MVKKRKKEETHATVSNFVETEKKKVDVWKYKKYICKVKPIGISANAFSASDLC